MLHPHLPHPHVHPEFDEHPWRMLPVALGTIRPQRGEYTYSCGSKGRHTLRVD